MNTNLLRQQQWICIRTQMLALVAVGALACAQSTLEPGAAVPTSGPVTAPTTVGGIPQAPSPGIGGAAAPTVVTPVATPTGMGMDSVPAAPVTGASPPAAPAPSNGALPQLPAKTPFAELPPECRGFEVLGLTQSPGGSTLPNLCAPFDGTYNNPYAIRCVEANPAFKTAWSGDELCILPPPPELGTQIHIAPNFDDPASVKKYELQPGEESNTNYYINSDNTEMVYYYRTNWRMRGGSHHMIISLPGQDRADGWAGPGEAADLGFGTTGFGGTQRADADRPSGTLDTPPENVGMGGQLAPKQQFNFNLHHMNHFDKPILREVWVNIWYEKNVTKVQRPATLFGPPGDVAIPPGEHRMLHYRAAVNGDMRIIQYFGHRHVSTDRFAIWVERANGEKISAYESFSWEDMPVYQYDSVSKNPVPDVANKVDGGHSGLLEVKTGDSVHFVCDITNRQDQTLRFANELYSGEMCIVFGNAVGSGSLGQPVRVRD
jgi:hypothetical protein